MMAVIFKDFEKKYSAFPFTSPLFFVPLQRNNKY